MILASEVDETYNCVDYPIITAVWTILVLMSRARASGHMITYLIENVAYNIIFVGCILHL